MENIKNYLTGIKPRKYQEEIYTTCKNKNCLVVLPTGLGKTLVALMLAIERMAKYSEEKVLFLAPTKPLALQHLKYFKKHLPELFATLELFTGKTNAETRRELWQNADIIFSTPQCIDNDLANKLYDLKNVSLLVVDECHRCLKNYAYTRIARTYAEHAKNPRILGLTASPGHEKIKIDEIAKNLDIEAVEIRTRESEDVKEYLQELKFEIIKLDFPEEFQTIRNLLKVIYLKKIEELKNRKLLFGVPNKVILLEAQRRIMKAISQGNHHFNLLSGASACATALKVQHALELVETQTLYSLQEYILGLFDSAKKQESKAVQQLVKQAEFNQAYTKLVDLIARKIEHPKLIKLKELIIEDLQKNPRMKAIVFAQYRDTVTKICKTLNEIPGINARVFVGQAKKGEGKKETGLSQREQQEIIHDFSLGKINVLVATQIGEEGLDIPEVNSVIFYEPIPSAIRQIQRCLPAESKILMAEGNYKKISEICKGDKVISYNEKLRILEVKEVTRIFKNTIQDIIEITTEKNNTILLTKEHPVLTQKGWERARNLKKSEYIALGHSPNILVSYSTISDFFPIETYICINKEVKWQMMNQKMSYIKLQKELMKKGLKVNKKTLWGYLNIDAMPINLFIQILNILKINPKILDHSLIKSRKGNKISFSKVSLSEMMWLAGIIASDGDLRLQSKIRINRKTPYFTYKFRVCNTNKDILNKARNILKKIGLKVRESREDQIETNNTIVGKILNNLGIPLKKKSKTIELSEMLFQANTEAIQGFLAGLFDGDGNYNKGPCQIRLGTASKKFAFQLQSLLLRMGINPKVCQFDKTETRNIKGKIANFTGDFFSVEIYKKEDVTKFLSFKEIVKVKDKVIPITFSKNSKIEKNVFWVKIKSIKDLPDEETFNIEIKDNNAFLAENIIVHNSGRTARLMPGAVKILITKATRDEAYYWSAFHKEKKMYKALDSIKKDMADRKFEERDKQKELF